MVRRKERLGGRASLLARTLPAGAVSVVRPLLLLNLSRGRIRLDKPESQSWLQSTIRGVRLCNKRLLLRGLSHPCVDTNHGEPKGSVICVRRVAQSLEHAQKSVGHRAMLTRQRFIEETPVIRTCRPMFSYARRKAPSGVVSQLIVRQRREDRVAHSLEHAYVGTRRRRRFDAHAV